MKKFISISVLVLCSFLLAGAQDDRPELNDKMQQKLREYIQKRLGLTRSEAERLGPVFGRYLMELRKTHRELPDPLVRQQRIAEIRIRYRDEFRPILGEQRAGKIFVAEKEFYDRVRDLLNERRERIQDRPKGKTIGPVQ
jgi:hypothetical protein